MWLTPGRTSGRKTSAPILFINTPEEGMYIAPIAQLVSALDLVTSSEQVEGSILNAGKKLSLKNLNVIIRAIN